MLGLAVHHGIADNSSVDYDADARTKRWLKMETPDRNWVKILAQYKQPNDSRGFFELGLTFGLFVSGWVAVWAILQFNIWLALMATIIPAAFLVRLFAIQHDCGHYSLFSSRAVNDWVGRSLGVLTATPYDYWRHAHALHHASSGNLDKRGFGDITTLTAEEYEARTPSGKFLCRLYRNPIVLFIIGPAYMFFLQHRLPIGAMNRGAKPWISTMATNAAMLAIALGLIYWIGWADFLIIQVPIVFFGAVAGVWLFYVQHQYEETSWENDDKWSREHSALHGSSYYALPKPLMWLTANIGIHHVHHLSAKIPFFRLPQIVKDHPELKEIGRLTVWDSIKCIPLTLWDEGKKEMISFRQHRKQLAAAKLVSEPVPA